MIGLKRQIYNSCALWTGEQLYILECLSTTKQDEEIINPFKFSVAMLKNDNSSQKRKDQNENSENLDPEHDITVIKYLLQKEGHKQKTEALLESFRCSNFFVRIADSVKPLWSKISVAESLSTKSEMAREKVHSNVGDPKEECLNFISAVIDQGRFDCSGSTGVARNNVRCCSLPSGDIVKTTRKLVHMSVGLVFMLCWPLFRCWEAPYTLLESIYIHSRRSLYVMHPTMQDLSGTFEGSAVLCLHHDIFYIDLLENIPHRNRCNLCTEDEAKTILQVAEKPTNDFNRESQLKSIERSSLRNHG